MKTETKRKIILTTLSILSAFVLFRHEILNLNKTQWFIFDSFETLFWYGLGFLIAIPAAINAAKSYKKSSSKVYLIPIILGLATFLSLGLQLVQTKNDSPIILWAHYDGDTNGLTLKLIKDKTYELENYSALCGDFIVGNYRLENDTIYLDLKEPMGNDFMNDKSLITKDKVLFHLDEKGEYEIGFLSMRIIEKKI